MRAILEDYFAKMLKIDHDVIRRAMHASHANEGVMQCITACYSVSQCVAMLKIHNGLVGLACMSAPACE